MRLGLLLAAVLVPLTAGAQIYTWKDADGKTHFGDRPPPEAKTREIPVRSYEAPAQVRDWSKVIRGAARPVADTRSQAVTMYATDWCGVCRRARAYFAANGIAYTEIDVEKSEAGRREFEQHGGRGVPLIVMGGKVMRGFSPEGFERMRKAAAP